MLTRNKVLGVLLIDIFLFPLSSVALDVGTRVRYEAGFSKIELVAMEEMGWGDERLEKYTNVACGYLIENKSNSLQQLYKSYFGKRDPNIVPELKNSLRKIHNWSKQQPECSR